MFRSILLVLGVILLSLALLGAGYLYTLGRTQEVGGLLQIPGATEPGATEFPVATEAPSEAVTEPPVATEETSIVIIASDTPQPSSTPSPLSSATVSATASFVPVLIYCTTSPFSRPVVVRTGPGTEFPQMEAPVPVGTCFLFNARNEQGNWLQIAPEQQERILQQYAGGWISTDFLDTSPSDPGVLPAVTLTPTFQPGIIIIPSPTAIIGHNPSAPIASFKPVSLPGRAAHLDLPVVPSIHAAPATNFMVEAEWPARIEVDGSGTIRVSLVRTDEGFVPTVEISGNTPDVFTPIPVGTPGQELGTAFGDDYIAKRAIARIAGASFAIQPVLPAETQSLDESKITWTWNFSSDTPARNQGIDLVIQIEWQHVDDPQDVKSGVIWRDHRNIDVFQPVIKAGQISWLSLVSGFLGSGLSIPWLFERLDKRKSPGRKKTKPRA